MQGGCVNNAEKIQKIKNKCGEVVEVLERKKILGIVPYTKKHGWLRISENNDHWSVAVTNGKTTHNSLNGPAFAVDFKKENGERKIGPSRLTGVWRSIIFMNIVSEEKEIKEIFDLVVSKIDIVNKYLEQTLL